MTLPPPAQLTHVGLYVDDMGAMVAFYTDLLGLVVTDQGEFTGHQLTFLSRRAEEHHQLVLVTVAPTRRSAPPANARPESRQESLAQGRLVVPGRLPGVIMPLSSKEGH